MAAPARASQRLRRAKERILAEWEKQVRASTLPARGESEPELRNSLPKVLDVLIDALDAPGAERLEHAYEQRLARGHGRHRADDSDYSLAQVIAEYNVLLRVVLGALEADGGQLDRGERDVIIDVLFVAVKGAASEFQRVRDVARDRAAEALGRANAGLQEELGAKAAEAVVTRQVLDTIFDRVEDYAIFTLDPEGVVTSWARGAQRMKQYTSDEIVGRHFSLLYPEEGRVRDEPRMHLDIAAREGRFRGEGLRQRKDGQLFLADVLITPMREHGRLVGFLKVVADLTERNRVIQERDLSRTRAESLELESELRDRFIFTLSHDLRNPLSAARMAAHLIARQRCGLDQHRELAERALKGIVRADAMIHDLLDASRIKAGQPVGLTLEEYDLAHEIEETCSELATVHGDRFRYTGPDSVVGYWDRAGLRRVIENLLTNAVKYGDPTAEIAVAARAAESRVIVTVHNFGSPIDQKDLESLFDLFRRSASAEASPRQGWGLGLTLVRGITEAHGGIVKVRSLAHEGTSFVLDLPRDARPFAAQRVRVPEVGDHAPQP